MVVSPGFTPRPSLSEGRAGYRAGQATGVAGVYAPAFVERMCSNALIWIHPRVAGVYAPAFVERLDMTAALAEIPPCRRGLRPGLR